MLTDLEIGNLLQQQYDAVEGVFDFSGTISDVSLAVKTYEDCVAVLFEGSHDIPDWKHDFEAEIIYPYLLNGGGVHAGFWEGLTEAINRILPYLAKDKPIILCGHSLGAGRVNPAAALLQSYGFTLMKLIKFASPRSNDDKLSYMISCFPLKSYWNYHDELHHDFVCDVPRRIEPEFSYNTTEPKTMIDSPPPKEDSWGVWGWHHLSCYIRGLEPINDK